jgi:hypothetical protein
VSLRRSLLLLFALGLVAAAVAIACGGTATSDTITPITGIVIRAERLTTGRGCGTKPGQVFKYAAVVFEHHAGHSIDTRDPGSFDLPLTANVYDCFTDGTFVELPASPGDNSVTYRIELYIYDQPAYAQSEADIAGATNDIALALDAAALPAATAAVGRLRTTRPVWTTTCGATQQEQVEVLAVCDPIAFGLGGIAGLSAGDAGATAIDLATGAFALAGGGVASCGDEDGGVPEAGPAADAGDAGDAGDAEAGAPDAAVTSSSSLFRTVHVVPSGGAAATDVTCPDHFHLDQLTPLTTVSLDVTLLRSDGSTLGKTTCSALTRLGETSSATCEPVK